MKRKSTPAEGELTEEEPGECPRAFVGFVGRRGDICPRTLGAGGGQRMKRQSFPAEGELTEEKLVNVHAHSRDPFAHEATLPRAVGSAWRKTLYVVGTNAFGRKKQYLPRNRYGKAGTREWGGAPPAEGELTKEEPGECPRIFAGFVGLCSCIGPRTHGAGGSL